MSGAWQDFESIRRPQIIQYSRELERPALSIFWSVRLTIIFLGLQLILGIIFAFAGAFSGTAYYAQPMIVGLINTCSFLIVYLMGVGRTKLRFGEAFALSSVKPSLILPMTLTVLSMWIVLSELSNVIAWLIPPSRAVIEIFEGMDPGESIKLQSIGLLCVVAPITEEVFFRGILLRGMRRRHSAVVAILVSALLFAIMHLNPWQAGPAFLAGIVFGWWFLRTGSLWPSLIGHAVNNGIPSLLTMAQLRIPGGDGPTSSSVLNQPLRFDVTGLALLVTSICVTAYLFSRMPRSSVELEGHASIMARPLTSEP